MLRAIGHAIGALYLRLFGWELVGAPAPGPKQVMIAAPHTSNWDLVVMLATAWAYGARIRWIGKKELFDKPLLGWFLFRTGGIAIDRSPGTDTVAQIVEVIRAAPEMILCIAPEGTRGHREYWRSGFYHMARGASIPISFGFVDWGTRRTGCGGYFVPTGDVVADMDRIRAFYGPIAGLFPERKGPIRLKDEEAPAAPPA